MEVSPGCGHPEVSRTHWGISRGEFHSTRDGYNQDSLTNSACNIFITKFLNQLFEFTYNGNSTTENTFWCNKTLKFIVTLPILQLLNMVILGFCSWSTLFVMVTWLLLVTYSSEAFSLCSSMLKISSGVKSNFRSSSVGISSLELASWLLVGVYFAGLHDLW